MAGSKKLRVGVLGGGFSTAFQFHEHPNSEVTAICDIRSDRLDKMKETFKCDISYTSYDEMLADKNVDAVAVFSGAPDHVPHGVAAMKAGKHVVSAVPAAISVEQCEELRDTVEKTGLTYMMAETSYYRQPMIAARKFYSEGKFGEIFYTEAEYHHAGIDPLFHDPDGKRTWRYVIPPMLYPTHCTAFLVGLTGERLTDVTCIGWGDDSHYLKENMYNNPFWNETALFKTDKGHAFRVSVYWEGAHKGCERAQWYGSKMSFFTPTANGQGAVIVRRTEEQETDDAGFVRNLPKFEEYEVPNYFDTDMLPKELQHSTGHGGSHAFLTHEFVDSVVNQRKPAIDVYEAIAYTIPGIMAHQSALKGGEQMKVPCFDRK